MAFQFYAHPKCSTCTKARDWLSARGIEFDEIDIRETPPTEAELRQLLAARGKLKSLFNTSGMAYRQQGLGAQVEAMSESDALALLRSDGMLVKRPVLIGEGIALNGFREKEWAEIDTQ